MRFKKFAAMVAVVTLLVTCGPVALGETAEATTINFRDVDSSHWAQSSIDFAVDKGIVKGYYDEYSKIYTFLPEKAVTYEEAGVMLWRALNAANIISDISDEKKADLLEKYQSELDGDQIAQWAQLSVADLVDREIIELSELKLFVGAANIGNSAPRTTVARWTAKALNRGLAGVYYLPYTDAAQISASDRPYIDMLYRQGIMKGSLQMDGTTAFLPNAGVKRCEFAAIANRVYENKSSSYDYTKDIYSYDKSAQLSSLYMGSKVNILKNGTEATSGNGGSLSSYLSGATSFVISGIATDENETPQIHIDTIPASGNGTIKSKETISNSSKKVTKVGIAVDGVTFYFLSDNSTSGDATLSKGQNVKFLADGVWLVELVDVDK